MEQLYLWLDLGSLAIPLLFSFHPKIKFYRKWPSILPGILVMMLIFIPWDIYFTAKQEGIDKEIKESRQRYSTRNEKKNEPCSR